MVKTSQGEGYDLVVASNYLYEKCRNETWYYAVGTTVNESGIPCLMLYVNTKDKLVLNDCPKEWRGFEVKIKYMGKLHNG